MFECLSGGQATKKMRMGKKKNDTQKMKGKFVRGQMRESKLKKEVEAADGEPAVGEELLKTPGGDEETPQLPGCVEGTPLYLRNPQNPWTRP